MLKEVVVLKKGAKVHTRSIFFDTSTAKTTKIIPGVKGLNLKTLQF